MEQPEAPEARGNIVPAAKPEQSGPREALKESDPAAKDRVEYASAYCPRCSAKLEQRSCKMICGACGYYMSCSDFY
ncbi:MAG TPA: hypothetical protein VJR23_12765 [Candidatus Acidoferrales bacterium]|nr:hypothetical protein [Candidatus Acidoferrales bacterium]